MQGASELTVAIAFRLPNDIHTIYARRVEKSRGRWRSIGHYLQERAIYEALRKHNRKRT